MDSYYVLWTFYSAVAVSETIASFQEPTREYLTGTMKDSEAVTPARTGAENIVPRAM